jgi:hypothetical protein
MFTGLILFIAIIFLALIFALARDYEVRKKIDKLARNAAELTPEEFFTLRKKKGFGSRNKHISTECDFAGVYILYNHSKDKSLCDLILRRFTLSLYSYFPIRSCH